jgi:hypothetical protein
MTDRQAATAADIVRDCQWFPEALDAQNRTLHFVKTDRKTIASRPFLSQSLWNNADLDRRPLGLETVVRQVSETVPHVNFIWHTAYCSSTAISLALDLPGQSLSIREPDALTVLARMKRGTRGSRGSDIRPYLASLLTLLSRPFVADETVTIKPANAANCLIRDAAALTTGKMLFLYSDCRSFLISTVRRGEARRAFVRRLFAELQADGHQQKDWPPQRLFEMSDMQIAALVWHMQIAEFARSKVALGDRAASLDRDAFLASPADTIEKLATFFGLAIDSRQIAEIVAGPLLRRNAKNMDEPFDAAASLQPADVGDQMARDLDEIVAWSYEVCKTTPRDLPLTNPLVETGKTYRP